MSAHNPIAALHESAYGPKRTCSSSSTMSALGGKADIGWWRFNVPFLREARAPRPSKCCPLARLLSKSPVSSFSTSTDSPRGFTRTSTLLPLRLCEHIGRVHWSHCQWRSANFSERRGALRPISPSCRLLDASLRDLFRVQRCDVDPATTDPCFRKPSLIACLIPSSINVLATSGTLVPWVPSLDSWSKNHAGDQQQSYSL
jgi:hypothetical protein